MGAGVFQPMRIRAASLVLLLISVLPLQLVSAEENDSSLEAREAQAEFFPDTETTQLLWRNIITSDGLLLDQLKMATYEVHRKEGGRFFAEAITPETMIAENIPACYMNDLNEDCSGKYHSILFEPEPGTETSVSYAIVTILRDGSRTEIFNIGYSQTPQGHMEIVAESNAPESFTASYDIENQRTDFTWRPTCDAGNYVHALYEHAEPATKSGWDSMDKTLVTNFIDGDASEYSIDWTNESVDRETYYTLTCWYPPYCDDFGCYGAREDTRLHSGNSLSTPVIEDNQAPRYGGSLSAQFNDEEDQTILQWSDVSQEDISKILIYHASSPIVSIEQEGIHVLAELDSTSIEFIHQLPADWMLTSYYAIGLVDQQGNAQIDEFDVSGKVGPILERNLPISISSFEIQQENSTLHFQWDLDTHFIDGDAILWKANTSNADLSPAWEEVTRLSPTTLEHHMSPDVLSEAWYALTLDGTWGSSPSRHSDNRILLGTNAVLFTPIQNEVESETGDESTAENSIELPEFRLDFVDRNLSLYNGDWVTLESTTNATYTIEFAHSQNNSAIRWTDALNTNPFWSAVTKTENGFSITINEPTNLVHIESTNVNGEIHIVRVGVDWPDEQPVEPEESDEVELVEEKASKEDKSSPLPILIVIGVIVAYILIVMTLRPKNELPLHFEEE